MNYLEELRKIKGEVEDMPFSYENVHRGMHLVYLTKEYLSISAPIPNKEIACHQANRIFENDFKQIVKSGQLKDLKEAYTEMLNNFKVVLNFF